MLFNISDGALCARSFAARLELSFWIVYVRPKESTVKTCWLPSLVCIVHQFTRLHIDTTIPISLVGRVGCGCKHVLSAVSEVRLPNFSTSCCSAGPNCCFNNSRIPYYLEYEPHSTSVKNLAHLAQSIGTFPDL